VLASFHLVRYPRAAAPEGFSRMGLDRPLLRRTPGLRFWKLLGTGRTMSGGADLRRWALFAVWEEEPALDGFLAGSQVATRWAGLASEAWHVRLEPLRAHGAWGGIDPLAGVPRRADAPSEGAVAILTRATIRPTRLVRFHRAAGATAADLGRQPGLLATVAIGERPVGRWATFSLWRSLEDARTFAYARHAHGDVVRRTRQDRWFAEELFARFRPYGSAGTWDGRDPLA
jgi:hypothetical protein